MTGENPHLAIVDRLQKLIEKFSKKAPAWLQALVFFMFVVFFLYTCFRFIGGDFAVRGRMAVRGVDEQGRVSEQYASGFEICIEDKLFATNSQGFFYAILTPAQYYALFARGSIGVGLSQGQHSLGDRTLQFERTTLSFRKETIDPRQFAELRVAPQRLSLDLVSAAWAQSPNIPPNRLFVEEIALDREAHDVRLVKLELKMNKSKSDLQNVVGGKAGELPLTPGISYRLGQAYYFGISRPIPNTLLKIVVSADTGFFSDYEEDFVFRFPTSFGRLTEVRGAGGSSTLRLVYLSPVDFVVYQRPESARFEKMRATFERAGVRLVQARPLSGDTATGMASLQVGDQVPLVAIQTALRAIRDSGVPLTFVNYRLGKYWADKQTFARPYEMLLVQGGAYGSTEAWTPAHFDLLLAARNESDLAGTAFTFAVAATQKKK